MNKKLIINTYLLDIEIALDQFYDSLNDYEDKYSFRFMNKDIKKNIHEIYNLVNNEVDNE